MDNEALHNRAKTIVMPPKALSHYLAVFFYETKGITRFPSVLLILIPSRPKRAGWNRGGRRASCTTAAGRSVGGIRQILEGSHGYGQEFVLADNYEMARSAAISRFQRSSTAVGSWRAKLMPPVTSA
jgi:hypothetical protein